MGTRGRRERGSLKRKTREGEKGKGGGGGRGESKHTNRRMSKDGRSLKRRGKEKGEG